MNELRFTLGPWSIEQYTPNEQVVDENTHYGIVAGTTSVATLIELSEETEANAKLIACSPDMLTELTENHEFLLQLYSALDNRNGLDFNSIQQDLRDRMAKQLQIIDKATK